MNSAAKKKPPPTGQDGAADETTGLRSNDYPNDSQIASAAGKKRREGIFISKQTLDCLLKYPRAADMIALYTFYCYTALWQRTNRPHVTRHYVMKGLRWGKNKVIEVRSLLRTAAMIEDAPQRDGKTRRVKKWYVGLPYFHCTDFRDGGVYEGNSTVPVLPPVEKPVRDKCLRADSTNALRANKKSLVTCARPPTPEQQRRFNDLHEAVTGLTSEEEILKKFQTGLPRINVKWHRAQYLTFCRERGYAPTMDGLLRRLVKAKDELQPAKAITNSAYQADLQRSIEKADRETFLAIGGVAAAAAIGPAVHASPQGSNPNEEKKTNET